MGRGRRLAGRFAGQRGGRGENQRTGRPRHAAPRRQRGWGVEERGGYPSNFEKVSSLILKLANLKALQSVPVAASDRGVLGLQTVEENAPAGEAGTVVEVSDAEGRSLGVVTLGKIHMTTPAGSRPEIGGTATGRYVLTARQPGTAYIVSETFTDVETAPSAWIDTTFVRPGLARRVEVTAAGKDRAWTIRRDVPGAAWQLDGLRKNQSADTAKLMSIDSLLTGMAVADVPDAPDDARLRPLEEKPVTVTADTFDGVRYVFTIGEGGGDNLPVAVAAEALELEEEPAAAADAAREQRREAQRERLEEAARFRDRVIFVPRNFVEPFFAPRASLIGGTQP